MKAIIFDLDNTLIDWRDDFVNVLKKILNEEGIRDKETIDNINNTLDDHKNKFDKLTKDNMLNFINQNCHLNLNMNFLNKLIEEQKSLFYIDNDVNETIKYLSKKYDLYVMTDWFTETQEGRLKNMGILKYFKKVYGADINYCKKCIKAFDVILKNYQSSECLFIGDNLEVDVKNPLKVGMNVIWKTNEECIEYKTIKNISDLKYIL